MTATLAALRFELLTALRTRELYLFGVLPALLGLPLVTALAVLVASVTTRDDRVAVPAVDPPGLALAEALDEDWEVIRAEDPAAVLAAGDADAAVLDWRLGPEEGPWVEATIQAGAAHRTQLERGLREGLHAAIDARIEEAGGTPVADRRVADLAVRSPFAGMGLGWLERLLPAYVVFLAAYLGCFLVPARTAAERLGGVLEAMAVTSGGAARIHLARAAVSTAISVVLVSLPALALWLMTASLLDDLELPLHATTLLEGVLHLFGIQVLYLGCGLLASSTRTALYGGSYLVLLALPVYGANVAWNLPWVPVVGLGAEGPLLAWGVRMVGAAALIGAAAWGITRLARGERALPLGEVDE